ncbi:MAG: hypothetical protein NZO16_04375, partial [Deltaproteobacteria bacterium]|nr:hypothetical protein [Deltaproteobacteria bacterium]
SGNALVFAGKEAGCTIYAEGTPIGGGRVSNGYECEAEVTSSEPVWTPFLILRMTQTPGLNTDGYLKWYVAIQ